MACSNINIRDHIGGTAGGIFSYIGYDSSSSSGSYTDDPGIADSTIFTESSDDTWIFNSSTSSLPVGYYKFRYTTYVDTLNLYCPKFVEVVFHSADPRCPGSDWTKAVCAADNTPFFVFGEVNSNSACGSVTLGDLENTDSPSGPGGSVTTTPPFLRFVPIQNSVGEHEFTHTAAAPSSGFPVYEDCADCYPTSVGVIEVRPKLLFSGSSTTSDCTTGCSLNLNTLVTITTGGSYPVSSEGNWSYVSSENGGASPQDIIVGGNVGSYVPGDLLSPSGPNTSVPESMSLVVNLENAVGGLYTFEYCVFRDEPCEECTQVTVDAIQCDSTVEITSVENNCAWTIDVGLQGDPTTALAAVSMVPDSFNQQILTEVQLTSCNGVEDNILVTSIRTRDVYIGWVFDDIYSDFTTSGYGVSMELHSTEDGAITVPISPSTAELTGPGGTFTAGDLDLGVVSVWVPAVKGVTINYLDTLGYTEGVDYEIEAFTTIGPGGSTASFIFKAKHLPSGNWIGPSKTASDTFNYDSDGASSFESLGINSTSTGSVNSIDTVEFLATNYPGLCSDLTSTGAIDTTGTHFSTDYDEIVLVNPQVSVINPQKGSTTCNSFDLTATVSNCSGSIDYAWSTTETTQTINVDSGTYTVETECLDNSCISTDTITV